MCLNQPPLLETVSGSFVKVGVSRCLVLPSGGSSIVVVEVDSASFGLEASTGYIALCRYTYNTFVVNVHLLSVYEKRSGLIGSVHLTSQALNPRCS